MNAIFCLNCRAAKTDHSSVLSLCKMFQICCFTMLRVNFSCAHNAVCAKECMVIFIRSQDLPELLDNVHAITRSSFVTSWRFLADHDFASIVPQGMVTCIFFSASNFPKLVFIGDAILFCNLHEIRKFQRPSSLQLSLLQGWFSSFRCALFMRHCLILPLLNHLTLGLPHVRPK